MFGDGKADARIVVSAPLALQVEKHHVLSCRRRLDDFRSLKDALLLDVMPFLCRHRERYSLVLPRDEIARRVASDAYMRAIAGAAADLVLSVPVPDIAVFQESAAVRVYMHAVRVLPDSAVRQRKRRRRKYSKY